MSTCEDCLYGNSCSIYEVMGDDYYCVGFKDKSKFIELPCRIGDYIKWRNECGDIVLLEVTGFDFDVKGNVIKYHTKYSDIQPFIDDENVINIIPKERLSQERG